MPFDDEVADETVSNIGSSRTIVRPSDFANPSKVGKKLLGISYQSKSSLSPDPRIRQKLESRRSEPAPQSPRVMQKYSW